MKKLLLLALLPMVALVACHKDMSSINVDPKNPTNAPATAFYSNAQRNLVDALTSANVNDNIFRLIMQYWQETTYVDESQYDITTRQNPRQLWNFLYRDVIRDIREAKKLLPEQTSDQALLKNQLAIAEITEIIAWYYLVTTFGNIPYTEAMDVKITLPKYDDQKTVYYDLLTRMDAAIANLDDSQESFGTADILYGGDVAAWRRFANSFKMKMGMTIADVDPAKAKETVESAVAGGVIEDNSQNAVFNYLSGPPNTNPIWVDLVQSGRKDFVANSTLVNRMQTLKDPRLSLYFTTDANGTYSGGNPGESSNYATFSKPSTTITAPDFPGDLMDYSEVEFLLAEAAQRGFNVPGTAAEHYNNAVTASIEFWGGTAAQAAAYLAQPDVVYNPANWQQRIGEQKWISMVNRGWDAWIEWRRLDYPQLQPASGAVSGIPLRFTYPIPEQNLNTTNYNAASAALGGQGDVVETRLFWDVK